MHLRVHHICCNRSVLAQSNSRNHGQSLVIRKIYVFDCAASVGAIAQAIDESVHLTIASEFDGYFLARTFPKPYGKSLLSVWTFYSLYVFRFAKNHVYSILGQGNYELSFGAKGGTAKLRGDGDVWTKSSIGCVPR